MTRLQSDARIDWDDFVERYWERAPTILQQAMTHPFLSRADFFEAALAASAVFTARTTRERSVRAFIDGRQILVDVARHLPERSDGDLTAYVHRMAAGRSSFALVLNELQAAYPPLFFKLRNFLSGLFARVGLPAGNSQAVAFIGNYQRSAFGVHRDDYSSFQFVLEGVKRFRIWPSSVFGEIATFDPSDYSSLLDQSTLLEGRAGDILYWPASYYHIGETDGAAAAASLAVEVPTRAGPWQWLSGALGRLASDDAEADGTVPFLRNATLGVLPELLSETLDAVLADREALNARLMPRWLVHQSAASMAAPEPQGDVTLAEDAWIGGDPAYPILVVVRDDEATCSANGHAFAIPAHPRILAMIQRLNAGTPIAVSTLLTDHQGDAELGDELISVGPDEVRGVLEALYALRALVVSVPGA